MKWLKQGDANMAYFHGVVHQIRNRNYIDRIRMENESWMESLSDIKASTVSFYKSFFGYNAEVQAVESFQFHLLSIT